MREEQRLTGRAHTDQSEEECCFSLKIDAFPRDVKPPCATIIYCHGFNRLVRSKVPCEQLRTVTGHRTFAISCNYDDAAPEHLANVRSKRSCSSILNP